MVVVRRSDSTAAWMMLFLSLSSGLPSDGRASSATDGRSRRTTISDAGRFETYSPTTSTDSPSNDDLRDAPQLPRRRGRRDRLRRALGPFGPLRGRGQRDDGGPAQLPGRKRQMYVTCFAIVFVWITSATLFYSNHYAWPIPQSFFYAVDAGMSIGFCTDVAETTVKSRAFTIIHILLGASCVGGALVLMVQSVLEGVASREKAVYGLILEGDSIKKAFYGGGDAGDYSWLSPLLGLENWVVSQRRGEEEGVLSYDDFREVLKNNRLWLNDKEFRRVQSFYDPEGKGCIRYEYFAEHFQGIHRILPMSRFVEYKSLPWRIFAKVWSVVLSLFTNEYHRIYLIFVLWIGMGITWGVMDQGWDVITATHFAVSALATGGLTAPPVDPTTGFLPAGPALFCGFYCLLGIPLMALTLGIFARVLVEGYVVEEELAAIARPLTAAECAFASKSLCSTDSAIHLSDYIVLQLMRQGKLSLESFEFMKRQYRMLGRRRPWLNRIGPD